MLVARAVTCVWVTVCMYRNSKNLYYCTRTDDSYIPTHHAARSALCVYNVGILCTGRKFLGVSTRITSKKSSHKKLNVIGIPHTHGHGACIRGSVRPDGDRVLAISANFVDSPLSLRHPHVTPCSMTLATYHCRFCASMRHPLLASRTTPEHRGALCTYGRLLHVRANSWIRVSASASSYDALLNDVGDTALSILCFDSEPLTHVHR